MLRRRRRMRRRSLAGRLRRSQVTPRRRIEARATIGTPTNIGYRTNPARYPMFVGVPIVARASMRRRGVTWERRSRPARLRLLMRRRLRSIALAFSAAACAAQPQPDLSDVTGARSTREVTGTAYGAALPGITAGEQQRFEAGLAEFTSTRNASSGLGPVMTGAACSACHDSPPAIGGTNQRLETRFGHRNADGSFDPLLSSGGPMLQDEAIGTVNGFAWVPEALPLAANVVARRRTVPVFGLGLVDVTP